MGEPSRFKKWYEGNKDSISAERKKKYANDPAYRDQQKQRSKEYRQRTAGVGDREYLVVNVEGTSTMVFTVSMVATRAGCSAQHIRNLQSRGTIPAPTITGARRLYTLDQLALITSLVAGDIKTIDQW